MVYLNVFFYFINFSLFNWRITLTYCKLIHLSTGISIGICISPPSWASLPLPTPSHPSRLSQNPGFEFPASYIYSKFPLATYLPMVMYMLQCYSLNLSHPLLPPPHPYVCSLCLCLHHCPEIGSLEPFSRVHIYALIYDICFFWLT